MTPVFSWTYDLARRRYVIRRGGAIYQEIIPNRQNPAHTRTYVERSVRLLNGES